MILDHRSRASLYHPLGDRLALALQALAAAQLDRLAPGRHELAGDDVFALVQQYDPKPRSAGRWEAHRRYIDVQYVTRGMEQIGVGRVEGMKVTQPYDPEKDVLFLEGDGDYVTLRAGEFVILHPADAHMPGLVCGSSAPVHKIVVKVRV